MNNIERVNKAKKLLEQDIARLIASFENYHCQEVEEVNLLRNNGKVQITLKTNKL